MAASQISRQRWGLACLQLLHRSQQLFTFSSDEQLHSSLMRMFAHLHQCRVLRAPQFSVLHPRVTRQHPQALVNPAFSNA